MFCKKRLFILLLSVASADESMQQLYMKNGCSSCHGIYAEGIGVTPRLQGRKKEVLIRRLKDLKAGKTRSAFGTVMISFAQSLSDEEVEKIAEYLSTLKKTEPVERYELEPDEDDGSS